MSLPDVDVDNVVAVGAESSPRVLCRPGGHPAVAPGAVVLPYASSPSSPPSSPPPPDAEAEAEEEEEDGDDGDVHEMSVSLMRGSWPPLPSLPAPALGRAGGGETTPPPCRGFVPPAGLPFLEPGAAGEDNEVR